jgi:hypothetical protein
MEPELEPTTDDQPKAKPPGYFATASDEEVLAECARLHVPAPRNLRFRATPKH